MTQQDIIDMAKQSGAFEYYEINDGVKGDVNPLIAFAKLVAEAEKERIAKKIEQLPFGDTAQSFAIFVRNDL